MAVRMDTTNQSVVDLSIVIVSFRVKEWLRVTLDSIFCSQTEYSYEVFVVDNDSGDGTAEMVECEFSRVQLIKSHNNGFSKGNNLAIERARGRFILVLNPDTKIGPDVIDRCIRYMDEHPDVGALGCKVLKPNGLLEKGCRRTFPDPLVSFFRLSGLALLFPNSKRLARYNLTYLPEDQEAEVDAISGCFMLIPKVVFDRVGLFDPDYFMYGEDLDLCFRIKSAGYRVHYYPSVAIVHYGGQSSRKVSRFALRHFHQAMWIFYRKHYSKEHSFFFDGIVLGAIWLRWSLMSLRNALREG